MGTGEFGGASSPELTVSSTLDGFGPKLTDMVFFP